MFEHHCISITGPLDSEPDEASPLSVRLLNVKDAMRLAPLLRPEDMKECEDFGYTARDALWYAAAFNHSPHKEGSFAVYSSLRDEDAPPVFAFGYSERKGGKIWMMGQEPSRAESLCLIRAMPHWVRRCVQDSGCPTLSNVIGSHNRKAISWLRRSGVFFVEARPCSRKGRLAHYYKFHTKLSSILGETVN